VVAAVKATLYVFAAQQRDCSNISSRSDGQRRVVELLGLYTRLKTLKILLLQL